MASIANIRVEPVSVTWNSIDLGYTDGDIELAVEDQAVDITSHQTGTDIIEGIRTGNSVSIAVTLKETSVAQIKAIFAGVGDLFTPAGMGATEALGIGNLSQFTGQFAGAQKLVLHPVALGATDYTRDIAFWKAYPVVESLTMSPENPETVQVTFKIFPDFTKEKAVNKMVFGDHTQDFDI